MFNSKRITQHVLPLALVGTALVAALASNPGFARTEPRIVNTEPPRAHASEAVVESRGPRGEVLLKQDEQPARVSEARVGRLGLLPDAD